MSSNPIRLQYLFDRYINNICSPDELKEFWQLMGELSENDVVTEEIKQLWEVKKRSRYSSENVDWDSLFGEMMRKGRSLEIDYERIGRRKVRWIRIAAAACVLAAIVTGGLFFLVSRKTDGTTTRAGIVNDLMPGKNGAILTLDNGRQVILDSTGDGVIAKQNGARIELNSGRLTYHKDDGSTAASLNTMTTPVGRKYQLTLSDGTRVWLNAASSVSYPATFLGAQRVVSITGEAYFEVAANANKPFVVNANGMMIEVLGTNFNINAYSDEDFLKTTLLSGSVRLKKGSSEQLLSPGQQARWGKDEHFRVTDNTDMDLVMAWKNDEFYFSDADLPTVMRQLSRWYDLEVIYEPGAPLNKHFEGEIPMNTMISQVLSVLEKNDVHFHLQGKKLTVLP
ncbi:FecR domain-containing protein [Flavitalea sp. BT771]|uniref:FecR family protein n=1 Tax=Flavitalea sp. BT771 TaxID=3063329 RepID=UPI0026E350D0|nr:FecR family protein [Flavitalea sp. BT771]MDO6430074.1 FecR domain-containing protein [Flavitalea sp. BT771]MDV6219787.1 FecR domain-containing protein [Flavitalea sp. BT771]